MLEILLSIIAGIVAAFFVIKKENDVLKNKEKLHELELEDTKLQAEQTQIQKDKSNTLKQLQELEKKQAPALSDSEIEDFWRKK